MHIPIDSSYSQDSGYIVFSRADRGVPKVVLLAASWCCIKISKQLFLPDLKDSLAA